MSSKTTNIICYFIIALAFVNFLVFLTGSSNLGGDTFNGKTENGKYYVGMHEKYTQVSQQEYESLRVQEVTLTITWPLCVAALFYLNRNNIRFFGSRIGQKKSKDSRKL